MTSLLHKVEAKNFKAFRNFTLTLDGRHLLIYGDNGAGKSSLYWTIYTLLQSARKPKHSIAKYFDPADPQNLLNINEVDPATNPGEIALTLREEGTNTDTTYRLSQMDHDTHEVPVILKGDLASDFVTYRFFFGFSDFKNSDDFNIWPLFEREILPFCVTTGGAPGELKDRWIDLKAAPPNPSQYRGRAGAKAYRDFNERLKSYSSSLKPVVEAISAAAQVFYDAHFAEGDSMKITLKLAITRDAYYSREFDLKLPPVLRFGIQANGVEVRKPQSFMNEAKMTQLALSVRFASSLVNLHDSDLKLLVLDDLLVSLDMSNRMKVVDILLTDVSLANYQKIILTHDLGFFQEFKRAVGANHHDWLFQRLTGNAKDGPSIHDVKSPLEKAQHFLANDQLPECGNQLRKCVEENLAIFLEQAKRKQGLDHLIDRESFASLHHKLNEAAAQLSLDGYHQFAELVQSNFSLEQLGQLVAPDDVDVTQFNGLTREKKGAVIAHLYAARRDFQQCIINLLSDASRKRLTAIKLLNEVRKIKDRILNPASHAGAAPLYTKEAEDAVKVIQALDAALTSALVTL
jgi:energy-coupling factor transporter ATP-binding protein EcfA2